MYRKSIDTRIRRLERVESVIDVQEVAEHLRTGRKVKPINRNFANKLKDTIKNTLSSDLIPFYGDEPYAFKEETT